MGNQLNGLSSEDAVPPNPQDYYDFSEFVQTLKQGLVTPKAKRGARSTIGAADRAKLAQVVKIARDRYLSGILDFYERSEAFYNALSQVRKKVFSALLYLILYYRNISDRLSPCPTTFQLS